MPLGQNFSKERKMNTRPDLKVGDVVRLSRKGMMFHKDSSYMKWSDKTMTVVKIPGKLPQDGRDRIQVAVTQVNRVTKMSFRRKELWYTGYNIADKGKTFCATKKHVGQPTLSNSGVMSLAKHGFSMGATVAKPKLPDPCKKDEVKCSKCGRMADHGRPCWWCGQYN